MVTFGFIVLGISCFVILVYDAMEFFAQIAEYECSKRRKR